MKGKKEGVSSIIGALKGCLLLTAIPTHTANRRPTTTSSCQW